MRVRCRGFCIQRPLLYRGATVGGCGNIRGYGSDGGFARAFIHVHSPEAEPQRADQPAIFKRMTAEEKQTEYRDADWLRDTIWRWIRWSPPQADWDHDHCFFCQTHFCDKPDCDTGLRECWLYEYPPGDEGSYETVCANCFEELRDTFRWVVESPEHEQRA